MSAGNLPGARKYLLQFSVTTVLIVLLGTTPVAPAARLITLEEKRADVELTKRGLRTFTERASVRSEANTPIRAAR